MATKTEFGGGFLNVDLEVYCRRPLNPLAAALGEAADVLFLGKHGRRYLVVLELAGGGRRNKPDAIVVGLVKLIKSLPEAARILWSTASERRFDIGFDCPSSSHVLSLSLKPETIAAIAEVNGTIAVTIYPRREDQTKTQTPRQKTIHGRTA